MSADSEGIQSAAAAVGLEQRLVHAALPAECGYLLCDIKCIHVTVVRGFVSAGLKRRPQDLPAIRRELDSTVGAAPRAVYLHADICRQDLLVEIEAAALCPLPASA